MGSIYRKQTTRPLPAGAEIVQKNGEDVAQWRDGRGKLKSAPVTAGRDGSNRILCRSSTYYAKYRDGEGIVRDVATRCRDKQAATAVLKDLERRAELVRSNVITAEEDAISDHQLTPLDEHVAAYLIHLESQQTSSGHRRNVKDCLDKLKLDCRIRRLTDLSAEKMERWMLAAEKSGMGARTRNRHLSAISAFANWCVLSRRLMANPFVRVQKANEKVDKRRQRRALTLDEIRRLIAAAMKRPLDEALMIRRGRNKGKLRANVSPNFRYKLEILGWERALIYKTLILTGLRLGELTSLTLGQVHLDGATPFIELAAADEKNRTGAEIPLQPELAADLRQWIDTKRRGEECPDVLSMQPLQEVRELRLFDVPAGLVKVLNRDLAAAGIPKTDERGRTVDVHSLRHTFGTMLSCEGVAPRTAQAAMRHSDISLTMQVYTDPKLLDVHGALTNLPSIPLDGSDPMSQERATGTTGGAVAPNVAPKLGQPRQLGAVEGNPLPSAQLKPVSDGVAVTSMPDTKKASLSVGDNEADE
ncbi:MAG: tyrosine-type recombinase/integrase, partial [Planctomycetaceae bacterium]|nr:tyrosine-type recombinase/integrase [Planctomycetaceae bacterium]